MKILNHKLDAATYQAARWIGGAITPEIVVLHDTASRLEKGNAAAYLRENDAKVSVHFVVERDGSISQQVPVNRRANHAGQSSFEGRSGCNDFSIGIEIVNPGKMELVSASPVTGRAWFKSTFVDGDQYDLVRKATSEHGDGVWMDYTPAQIDAVLKLLMALFVGVKSLRDVTTHWYISPGRKVDVNPLFPFAALRAKVLGRDDPATTTAEAQSQPGLIGEQVVICVDGGDRLNLRRWPSFNPNVIAQLADGVVVPVIRRGTFAGRDWVLVQHGGHEGWVVASYTAPANYTE